MSACAAFPAGVGRPAGASGPPCRRRKQSVPPLCAAVHLAPSSHAVGGAAAIPLAATAAAEEAHANALGHALGQWVCAAGGYVHPALRLSLAAPHGRGVVAVADVAALDGDQPLVAVPERCLMTAEAAAERLGPMLQRTVQRRQRRWLPPWPSAAPPPPPQPDAPLLLALLLAAERRRGAASFWAPYIAALPEGLPCGWALPPQQLDAELAALGRLAEGWRPRVAAAAAAVRQRTEAAEAAYGAELGVTAGDVRWALGHVLSRCFGSGDDLALLPYIDLCNHRQHADTPWGHTTAAGEPCAAVACRHGGAPQGLAAGEELCISYVAGTSPLQMFLNFGFVVSSV